MVCDDVIFILSTRNDPDELEASAFRKRPLRFDGVNKSGSITEWGMSGWDAVTCRGVDDGADTEPISTEGCVGVEVPDMGSSSGIGGKVK